MKQKLHPIQEQLIKQVIPEVDYSYQKSISYSQFSTYVSCPYKWYLQYIENKGTPSSINMTFGTAIHETIQEYLKIMYSESGKAADEFNLEEYFQESFIKTYQNDIKNNNGIHFSSAVEMKEFYEDGLAILDFLRKNRRGYFSIKNTKLIGIEVPLMLRPFSNYVNLFYKGYIDLVLYDETSEEITIIDLKTATNSWGEKKKKDKVKQFQLVLYKDFFSKQYNFPIDKINVEFIILKRKLWEQSDYPQSRIQRFSPPSGKTSINKAQNDILTFIEECFDNNGSYLLNKKYQPNPSDNCRYCPFNLPELCKEGKPLKEAGEI